MPRSITVEITPDIIRRAKRKDCYFCLIALALRQATRLEWHVMDRDARIETLAGRKPIWTFPPHVRNILLRFDAGETVEPTRFRLPARFADTERWAREGAGIRE